MSRASRFTGTLLGRLLGGYVAVAMILAIAWTWSLYGPLTDAVVRQQQRNLTALAQSATLLTADSGSAPEQVVRRLVARTDLRMTIIAADGTVLADSDADPALMDNHKDRPEVSRALDGHVGTDRRVSRTESVEALYVAVPGSLDGSRVAVRVAQPLTEIEAIAARSRRMGFILLAVALVIAAGVSIRAAHTAARPVRQLSEAARRMADGDLDAPIPEMPRDLDGLARALDSLRDQVARRIDALDAERSALSATLDGLGDAVLVLDDDRIGLANREFGRMFGVRGAPVHGMPLTATGLPEPLVRAIQSLIMDAGDSCEVRVDPLGTTYRIGVSSSPAPELRSRYIVVISDVTERSRVDRVRRDFVANASHELKTPVAGIRLLADSAGSAAIDGDTKQALAFTGQIASEAARLQHLVGDLLDLSRLDTTAEPGRITDVREAVERAVLSHRPQANRSGLALTTDMSEVAGESLFARVDPTDMAIGLDNLIDNAVSYTQQGSVTVKVSASDDVVRLSVTDTGPGIAPEHQARIFERFYRIDSGRSRESGGTGLGLALVKHVAERAGGSISLDSQPGAGSTFTLTVPRAT